MTAREIAFAGQTAPLGIDLLFRWKSLPDFVLGCEICEDLWVAEPPSGKLARMGATVIANCSASDELIGKPVAIMTKDDKARADRFLSNSGAMMITKSGDKIAKHFGISKYTLYAYLDSSKTGGE